MLLTNGNESGIKVSPSCSGPGHSIIWKSKCRWVAALFIFYGLCSLVISCKSGSAATTVMSSLSDLMPAGFTMSALNWDDGIIMTCSISLLYIIRKK